MSQMLQNQTSPFSETADIETSSDDYAARFSGPTGEWMLCVQEKIALDMIRKRGATEILDVGGGHGQLALPLCRAGFEVTVVGSSESCRSRLASLGEGGRCRFLVGDVVNLPFEDGSFDCVISFRLMTHCGAWPRLVSELCRVARRSVVVDYPTSRSLNVIAPALFTAKKRLEGNTRTWRLFKHEEIRNEFEKHGFRSAGRVGQFFLPMVLHRALKSRRVSEFLERVCSAVGLSKLFGSPVIVEMVKPGNSGFNSREHE